MTDPELDALVHEAVTLALMLRMGERIAYGRDADIISRQTDAITALRRQLAEANQRADAAEAAVYERAAVWHDKEIVETEQQIERNNEYCRRMGWPPAESAANHFCRDVIQHHLSSAYAIRALATDKRPALDAMLQAEREKALREALEAIRGAGTFGKTAREQHIALEQYCMDRDAILALIDKEPTAHTRAKGCKHTESCNCGENK